MFNVIVVQTAQQKVQTAVQAKALKVALSTRLKTRLTKIAASVLVTTLLVSSPSYGKTWRINLRDAGFVSFVSEVADITGKNFVVDPSINRNITVISNKALNQDEVYNLFLEVLSVNGIVAVPSGNTIKLVPDITAKQAGVPFQNKGGKGNEQVVTRLIDVENNNPTDLITAVRPLMSQTAHMAALPNSKYLIVSDRAGIINQLEALIKALDNNNSTEYEFVQLKEASPNEIMDMLDQTLASTSGSAIGAAANNKSSASSIVADNRNNRLIVKGDKNSRQRILKLIKELDVPPASITGGSRMFKLKYTEAKDMVSMLQAWVSNTTPSNTSGTVPSLSSSSSGLSGSNSGGFGGSTSSNTSNSFSGSSNRNGSGNGNNDTNIFANESLNTVIVRANPTMLREISEAVKLLDVRRPQVLIQAAILEVTGDNAEQLGVQWAMGNPNTGAGMINFSNAGASLTSLATAYATNAAPNVAGALLGLGQRKVNSAGQASFYGAVLQALETNSKSNLLSAPYVTTLDNQEANLLVGQNVPFITGTSSTTSGGTSNPFTTIERKDVGISLKVKPRIGDGGIVTMQVEQEVSSVQAKTSTIASSDLITNKRKITTTVQVENEHIATLGGLMQDDSTETGSAVPWLGRIPFIGALFRASSNQIVKRNLLVFIQPTILDGTQSNDSLTARSYEQLRLLQLYLNPKGSLTKLPVDVVNVMPSGVDDAQMRNSFPPAVVPNTQSYNRVQYTQPQSIQSQNTQLQSPQQQIVEPQSVQSQSNQLKNVQVKTPSKAPLIYPNVMLPPASVQPTVQPSIEPSQPLDNAQIPSAEPPASSPRFRITPVK